MKLAKKRRMVYLSVYCMYCMIYQGEDDADKDEGAANEAGHEEEDGVFTCVLYVLYDLPG